MQVGRGFTAVARRVPRLAGLVTMDQLDEIQYLVYPMEYYV